MLPTVLLYGLVGLYTPLPDDVDEPFNVISAPEHPYTSPALTNGNGFTITTSVVLLQPVILFVKANVTFPDDSPKTTPLDELIVATEISLLTHVPPVVGDNVTVVPTQIELLPVMFTIGNWITTTWIWSEFTQPLIPVTWTVYVDVFVTVNGVLSTSDQLSQT